MKESLSIARAVLACLVGLGIASQAHAQSALSQTRSGYTCCNFHYAGDWISDANWFIHPKIPAGTPARILDFGDYRIGVDLGGRRMTLGLDYGRKLSLRTWAQLMIVDEDPKERIASWPEPVRDAIAAGKVAIGMTREQVLVAAGYPPAHQTPSTEAAQWKYWHGTHDTYLVVWDETGHVKAVVAEPAVRRAVVFDQAIEPTMASGGAPVTSAPVELKDLEGLLQGK